MRHPSPRRSGGFTLIELMVAVVVLGVLAAAAYPAMTSFLQRSRRADAIATLTTIVQAQERYRSNHASYANELGEGGLNINVGTASKYYDITLAGIGASASFVSGYTLTARPRSSTAQSGDTVCATLGVKLDGSLFTYSAADSSGIDKTAHCWGR